MNKLQLEGQVAIVTGAAEGVPLGRPASAQHITNACLFIASDQSAYVTGVVRDVSHRLHIH